MLAAGVGPEGKSGMVKSKIQSKIPTRIHPIVRLQRSFTIANETRENGIFPYLVLVERQTVSAWGFDRRTPE